VQHLQALALLQVRRDELHHTFRQCFPFILLPFQKSKIHFFFADIANAWWYFFDLAFLMAGGLSFGAAPASTGASAGLER
jgi:hypothetical protein